MRHFARPLAINRIHQALRRWYELYLSLTQVGGTRLTTLQAIFSSGVLLCLRIGWMGMTKGSASKHGGPSHHSEWATNSLGNKPREAQSARLSRVGTWCQVDGGNSVRMVDSLLPTKILNLLGLLSSQDKTVMQSHHACTSFTGTSSAFLTEANNLDKRVAPHNSILGIESCLTGATRVFAVTRTQVGA